MSTILFMFGLLLGATLSLYVLDKQLRYATAKPAFAAAVAYLIVLIAAVC